jgi:hypothetical protein
MKQHRDTPIDNAATPADDAVCTVPLTMLARYEPEFGARVSTQRQTMLFSATSGRKILYPAFPL